MGAVISEETSLVFVYDVEAAAITETEIDYSAETEGEKTAFLAAARYPIWWPGTTGSYIVPCNLSLREGTEDEYSFRYYDGYKILSGWSHGTATIDAEAELEPTSHF